MAKFLSVAQITAALLICFHEVQCHGRLKTPASRSSMWRYGFSNPINYDDNGLNCGGTYRQWVVNRGQCGICGDPYDGARENEALGRFANGVIAGTYNEGDVMPVTVEITANHLGWFEFRLCPVNNKAIKATQQCLDRYLLKESSTGRSRFPIGTRTGFITTSVELPTGLTCTQCVLQWKYHAGNNWGIDPETGKGGLGLGVEQEQFYGCADIAIASRGEGGYKPFNGYGIPCRSISRGNAEMDSWCEQSCYMGYCPPSLCVCGHVMWHEEPDILERKNPKQASVSTSKSKFNSRQLDIQNNTNIPNGNVTVWRSAGAYRGQALMDSWCEDNCNMGYCPPSHCQCVTVNLQENERLDRENPKQASVSTSKSKFNSSSVSKKQLKLIELLLSLNDQPDQVPTK